MSTVTDRQTACFGDHLRKKKFKNYINMNKSRKLEKKRYFFS